MMKLNLPAETEANLHRIHRVIRSAYQEERTPTLEELAMLCLAWQEDANDPFPVAYELEYLQDEEAQVLVEVDLEESSYVFYRKFADRLGEILSRVVPVEMAMVAAIGSCSFTQQAHLYDELMLERQAA